MIDQDVTVRLPASLTARVWAGVIWRAALTVLLLVSAWQVWNLRALPTWAQARIEREGDVTRSVMFNSADGLAARAQAEMVSTRTAAVKEIIATRKDLNRHMDELQDLADFDVAHLTTNLDAHALTIEAQIKRAIDGWIAVSQPIAAFSGQMAEAAPGILDPLTDCENNPSCFENRWRGLTFDLEQTMRAVQKASPEVAQSAIDSSRSVGSIAASGASMAAAGDKWVGRSLAPKTKKQAALAAIERFGLIGLRAWLLL